MIGDELVQAAIIEKIKTLAPIGNPASGQLVGVNEIKEIYWQGDSFSYPNVRVDLENNEWAFSEQENCQLQYAEFSIYVFSEERSSKQCSQIKSSIINSLNGIGFTSTLHGVKFSRLRMIENIPAIRETERLWRSQIKFGSRITSP